MHAGRGGGARGGRAAFFFSDRSKRPPSGKSPAGHWGGPLIHRPKGWAFGTGGTPREILCIGRGRGSWAANNTQGRLVRGPLLYLGGLAGGRCRGRGEKNAGPEIPAAKVRGGGGHGGLVATGGQKAAMCCKVVDMRGKKKRKAKEGAMGRPTILCMFC